LKKRVKRWKTALGETENANLVIKRTDIKGERIRKGKCKEENG